MPDQVYRIRRGSGDSIEVITPTGESVGSITPRLARGGLVLHGSTPKGLPAYSPGVDVQLSVPFRLDRQTVVPAGTVVQVLYPCDHYSRAGWHYRTRIPAPEGFMAPYVECTMHPDELKPI